MKKTCKYLIIGNSAGGIAAAEAIRQTDKHGTAVIVSDEPYHAYSRPLISKYLAGRCTVEDMLFRPADFYAKNGIEAVLGAPAGHLDAAGRTVQIGGDAFAYEKLLLAVGGKPIVPPIKDMGEDGVFTFTRLDDAMRIKEAVASGARRVVVVGGGLIGMSVTEALAGLGLEVTVVELKDRVLSLALDKTCSQIVERTLRENGVTVLTGHSVSQIVRSDEKGRVKGVILNSGQNVPCDLVILAIGVVPRVDLASGTGVAVNRGIVVDRHMKASLDDVYACGDVAEAADVLLGGNRVLPIWPSAYIGGRVAGLNMAGISTEYPGWVSHNAFNYFGLAIVSAGAVETDGEPGHEVLTWSDKESSRKVVVKENRIVGMVLSGDIQRAGILFNLMREKIDVGSFKATLLSPGFGLVSLPAEMRQQMISRPGITDTCLAAFKQPELALSR
ncbi:MAG: FAD-dependent oxidoreductase [Dehalococcoidia bacterium]|nr:FAD-dependent oxidoreductase [Dehalococcoidia bacterium]